MLEPQWIDSHCHLDRIDTASYPNGVPDIVAEAHKHQVKGMLTISVDLRDIEKLVAIAEAHPSVYLSVGVHPADPETCDESKSRLFSLAQHPKVVAIGETGLDYHHVTDGVAQAAERDRFVRHIETSLTTQKPVVIHTREAAKDTLDILRAHQQGDLQGIFHCFTEDEATARVALDLGFYISFSGIVTFKNATSLQEVARWCPWDRILVESDAPWLAPMPHRGKPNIPAWVPHTGAFVAQLKNVSPSEAAQYTTENFFRLFPVCRVGMV
ncbi:MAG: TatD family hydrolase [Pseudomonadota bacterium]